MFGNTSVAARTEGRARPGGTGYGRGITSELSASRLSASIVDEAGQLKGTFRGPAEFTSKIQPGDRARDVTRA